MPALCAKKFLSNILEGVENKNRQQNIREGRARYNAIINKNIHKQHRQMHNH